MENSHNAHHFPPVARNFATHKFTRLKALDKAHATYAMGGCRNICIGRWLLALLFDVCGRAKHTVRRAAERVAQLRWAVIHNTPTRNYQSAAAADMRWAIRT